MEDLKKAHSLIYKKFNQSDLSGLIVPLLEKICWSKKIQVLFLALPKEDSEFGVTEFINILAKLHYECTRYDISLKESITHKLNPPFLFVPDKGAAFVVSKIINQNVVEIINDDFKEQEINLHNIDFGTVYHFTYVGNEEEDVHDNWLFDHFHRFRKLFYMLLLVSGFATSFGMSNSLFIMNAYDKILPSNSSSLINKYFIGMLIVGLSAFILNKIRIEMLTYVGSRIDKVLGIQLFHHSMYIPSQINDDMPYGAKIGIFENFKKIKEFIMSPMAIALLDLPFVVIALMIVTFMIGYLAMLPLILIAIYMLFVFLSKPFISYYGIKLSQNNAVWTDLEVETLNNLSSIKLAGLSKAWLNRYEKFSLKSMGIEFRTSTIQSFGQIFFEVMFKISGLVIVCQGAILVIDQQLSMGALIASMMIMWAILGPFQSIVSALPVLTQVSSTFNSIAKLLGTPIETTPFYDPPAHLSYNLPTFNQPCNLSIEKVSYQYPNTKEPVIFEVSMVLQRGEFICLTGEGGAGKTTIMKLINKIHSMQQGEIYLESHNIKQITSYEIRDIIGYLPPNPKLMPGTILEILQTFNPNATSDEIDKVTQMLYLYDEIKSLSDGFNTYIAEHMFNQFDEFFIYRLNLAGLILKKPRLLMINNPRYSMDDSETEHLIRVLRLLKSHITILVATQNPLYLGSCDRIFYLKHKQIIMSGPPRKLLPHLALECAR